MAAIRDNLLPSGRHFAVLGEIAEHYAGMTSVVLHRSRAFAVEAGVPVEILTTGPERNYPRLEAEMLTDGRLVPGMRLRNMFDELQSFDFLPGPGVGADSTKPIEPLATSETLQSVVRDGAEIMRVQAGSLEDEPARIDYLRPDGTVYVAQRPAPEAAGKASSSILYLCDRDGIPKRTFTSMTAMRFFWFDQVFGADKSIVLSDSRRVAGYMRSYKRDNVTVVQTLHTNHLEDVAGPTLGQLERTHLPLAKGAGDFDAMVFLTERQKGDFEALLGEEPSNHVVPNARSLPTGIEIRRDSGTGIILSRLVREKRLEHAIAATFRAEQQHGVKSSLSIYGEGRRRGKLTKFIEAYDLGRVVKLEGYRPDASSYLAKASYLLLTSFTEGLPLVLVESMAAGCIPIAYDIKYGPGEIITDGLNGFLVEPGDVDGIASAIAAVVKMDPHKQDAMRRAAMERSRDFADRHVTALWGDVMRDALSRERKDPFSVQIVGGTATVKHSDVELLVIARPDRPLAHPRARIVVQGRTEPILMNIDSELETEDGIFAVTLRIPLDKIQWATGAILDLFLEIRDQGQRTLTRIGGLDLLAGDPLDDLERDFELYNTKYGNLSTRPSE